jgi:hypothetical protein
MGAARFAHLSRLASDPAYRLEVERSWRALKDKFAIEVDAARAEVRMMAELASVRRDLATVRSEAEQIRAANVDLQRKLQDSDAAISSLRTDNADLQCQLKALNNISAFLAAVARGER